MRRESVRQESLLDLDLTQEQREVMKEHFLSIDRVNSGVISISELRDLLMAVGETVTDETMKLLSMMLEERGMKKIDLVCALRTWSQYRKMKVDEEDEDDSDILHAFVAMGGNSDKSGVVRKQTLIDIITMQFGLTINIEDMLEEAGLEIDSDLYFSDFVTLLGSGGSQRTSRLYSIFSVASVA